MAIFNHEERPDLVSVSRSEVRAFNMASGWPVLDRAWSGLENLWSSSFEDDGFVGLIWVEQPGGLWCLTGVS